MAYASTNPKTKKILRGHVAAFNECGVGPVRAFSPGPFGCKDNGVEYIEGPHYPKAHTWYAKVEVKDGVIVKVLS